MSRRPSGDHAAPATVSSSVQHEPPERSFGLERLVFFSDAVFAIAITLLVIDLRLPEADEGATVAQLISDLVPELFAFFLSFMVIGTYWLAHWRRFGYVERVDERLAGLNLVLLAFIALMPFPTSVIASHGADPGAVILYVGVIALAGVANSATWLHAWRAGLLRPDLPAAYIRLATWRGLSVPLVMVLSLPLLLVGDYLVLFSWFLIIPVQAYLARRIRRLSHELGVPPPG